MKVQTPEMIKVIKISTAVFFVMWFFIKQVIKAAIIIRLEKISWLYTTEAIANIITEQKIIVFWVLSKFISNTDF